MAVDEYQRNCFLYVLDNSKLEFLLQLAFPRVLCFLLTFMMAEFRASLKIRLWCYPCLVLSQP